MENNLNTTKTAAEVLEDLRLVADCTAQAAVSFQRMCDKRAFVPAEAQRHLEKLRASQKEAYVAFQQALHKVLMA